MKSKHRRPATTQPSPIDCSAIVFAMRRYGVGFAFSDGGTLRLSDASACPSELRSAFLASDQGQICASVRAMLNGAKDPLAWPDEQPLEVAA